MEILSLGKLPFQYENQDKLDFALETIPLTELYEKAEKNMADSPYGFEDHLVIEMLAWFKGWFKWVNSEVCEHCGNEETRLVGATAGNPEEMRYGARNVEVYHCDKCNGDTRFPRYNDPVKLLQTRKGRCGEWANVFMLLLRALGLPARYVWNSEDHVWNEVWSSEQSRWIHVDSCEQAFDKPLTYTDGWGKKMAYVVGFSTGGARDITKRYVRRPDMQLDRNRFPEEQLESAIESITAECRGDLDAVDQVEWFERDEAERAELAELGKAEGGSNDGGTTTSSELPRQSGSAEWVKERGEDGKH